MKTTHIIACITAMLLIGCVSNKNKSINNNDFNRNTADKSKKELHHFSIESALESKKAQKLLDPIISTQFAGGSGRVLRSYLVSQKKSNAFGKSVESTCQQAFLSAIKQFQHVAKKSGGTGVINVISNYKKIPYSSDKKYQCAVGTIITNVELKGDIIL